MYIAEYLSPIGRLTLVSDGAALNELRFANAERLAGEQAELPVFRDTCRWLDIYFGGEVPNFSPKIELHGTEFQGIIWSMLRKIPYGKTVTYGELAAAAAKKLGKAKMSAQAVGGAVGKNPVGIIVPCHRVLGAGGALTGFGGGLDVKIKLLDIEKIKYKTI